MGFSENIALGLALLKTKILRRSIPFYVQFSITNRCNLRCKYCNIPSIAAAELSTAEIFSLIDQLREMGTRRVVILGGEPLIRDDIGEVIAYIKQKGMFCGLTTNGYFVSANLEAIMKLDTVAVSIDGREEEHDALRGKGSFKKAIEALTLIKKNKIPVVLSSTIVKANIKSLEAILEIAREFNCRALINIGYYSSTNSFPAKELQATDQEYRELFRAILSAKRRGAPLLLSEATYQYVSEWPDYLREKVRGVERLPKHSPCCQAGRLFGYIDCDGRVYPCALGVGEFDALNVKETGARKAWEHCRQQQCKACSVACFVEYNSILSLNPRVLWNTVQTYKKP